MYLEASDILVMNYPDTEHYRLYMSPTKLFAYMASGKIIIASDLQSVREIVDETCVVFVAPDDVLDLQSKLEQISSDLEIFKKLGAAGQHLVTQYSWENRAKRIIKRTESPM